MLIRLSLIALLFGSSAVNSAIFARAGSQHSLQTFQKSRLAAKKRSAHATSNLVQPRRMNTFQILTNANLWRQDMPLLLAQLPALQRAGEKTLLVFPDKAVSGTAQQSPEAARSQREKVENEMDQLRANPTALSKKLMDRGTPRSLKPDVLAKFPEDDSSRVAIESMQLFRPGLRVEDMRKELGPPERISRLVIESEGERRPLILTLYSYRNGAIVFAEADIAPRPGAIDRVILDIPAVTAALEREVP